MRTFNFEQKPLIKFTQLQHHYHDIYRFKHLPSGISQWHKCFEQGLMLYYGNRADKINGSGLKSSEELKKFDIIYINITGQDTEIPFLLRSKKDCGIGWDSDTVLVGGLDYSLQYMQTAVSYYNFLAMILNCYDVVIAGEPSQKDGLEQIAERKVHLVYHPCDTVELKKYYDDFKADLVVFVNHRYDNQEGLGVPLAMYINRKYPNIETCMLNISQNTIEISKMHYDNGLGLVDHDSFIEKLMNKAKIVIDLNGGHSNQGRVQMECACVKTPVIGCNLTHAQNYLYPELTTLSANLGEQANLIDRLITDKEFYTNVVEYAYNNVDFYSRENCTKRLFNAIQEENEYNLSNNTTPKERFMKHIGLI